MVMMTVITITALSRAHTSAKTADAAQLLLLNKTLVKPIRYRSAPCNRNPTLTLRIPPKSSCFFRGPCTPPFHRFFLKSVE